MQIINAVTEMRDTAERLGLEGRRIGFVPTMGFLHEGHLSLMRHARNLCDCLIASVFVNPTQFGPGEDLDRYPSDFERDSALCSKADVDIIFHPSAAEIYPGGQEPSAAEIPFACGLCGVSRPGHFQGVVRIVTILFDIIRPQVAVFGQKDAQQARIIQQLQQDLGLEIEVLVAPTVREKDGLAMSSRNAYLAPREREQAVCLSEALDLARSAYAQGERSAETVKRMVGEHLAGADTVAIDYVEIVDWRTFKPVEDLDEWSLLALAAVVGRARLIDNVNLGGVEWPGFSLRSSTA